MSPKGSGESPEGQCESPKEEWGESKGGVRRVQRGSGESRGGGEFRGVESP